MNIKWKLFVGLLAVGVLVVWLGVFGYEGSKLSLIACDVGQGDAYLVQKGSIQILIDAGPGNRVVNCLSKYMPFWDRKIEVALMTHPQTDHFGGFIEVANLYDLGTFLTSGLDADSDEFTRLKQVLSGSQTEVVFVASGDRLRISDLYFDILWPSESKIGVATGDQDVLGIYSSGDDPNTFSIVTVLHYKDFDAIFTGDIGPSESKQIAKFVNSEISYEYLKVPHHGSKNGLSLELLEVISPRIGVISAGKNNSYGHPHKQILDMLETRGVKVKRTDIEGDIVISSNGTSWWIE